MKVLAVCPNPTDITALYRVVQPLAALHRQDAISLTVADKLDYLQFSLCDVVLVQRPSNAKFAEYCTFVKNWNKPLWLDYDDDLLNVPEDNPASIVFNNPESKANIIKCLQMADVVSVSTKALQDVYSTYNKNVVIIPNALDLSMLPKREINWDKRQAVVAWRGGGTHEPDVYTVRQQLIDLSKQNDNWKFVFIGHDFKWLKWELGDKYFYVPKSDPAVYMKKLHNLSAPIHIVPLVMNEFNKSKSNIAMLEATYAGSAVVAPDMPEWKGCLTYKDPIEFYNQVSGLISNSASMKQAHDAAWSLINQEYVLNKVNGKRVKLIKGLV